MKKLLILLAVSFAALLPACQNNDDLWDAVNDLKSRVQALETQVAALNKNIEALQELTKSGQTITDYELKDGIYTITLSDGAQLTLTQGSDAKATIPLMGIDQDGYWVVDYQDGQGFQQILVDGKPVKAAGTDAAAPKFKIEDTTGYWMVSTDGGTTYNYVLNDKGDKVSAFGSGSATDSFFKSVAVKDGFLNIEMLTGETLSIPVVSNFYCRIITDEEGVQVFNNGEIRGFKVEIKGVESTKLTVPEGWSAQLAENGENEALLSVTAPASTTKSSRSIEANTRTDVVIEAFSNKYSCMSKIQVRLSDVVIPKVTAVTEKTDAATSSTLTFTVTVTPEGSDWYWICLPEATSAPTAAAIVASNNKGVGSEFTVSGLTMKTTYKVYAVAVASDGTVDKTIVSASATTTDVDYYEDGVTINGVTYSKDTEGAQLLSATASNYDITETTGVYFLDAQNGYKFTSGTIIPKGLVLIGRNPNVQPTIEITNIWKLGATATGEGSDVILKNVNIDCTLNNYWLNVGAAGICKTFMLEDCHLTLKQDKGMTYFSNNADFSIENIVIRNSHIKIPTASASGTNVALFIMPKQTSSLINMKKFVMENNVVYSPTSTRGYIFSQAITDATAGSLENMDIICKNNTFVNFIGQNTPYFTFLQIKSLTIEKNIFYSNDSGSFATFYDLSYMFRCGYDYNTHTPAPVFSIDDNKVFGLTRTWSKGTSINTTNSLYNPYVDLKTNNYTKEESAPVQVDFTNETFKSLVPGYGATLQ